MRRTLRRRIEATAPHGAPLARWLRPELFLLVAIFSVFYFFKLSNFSLSIDDELAAFRQTADVWVVQGRWGAYLFERWLLPTPTIPFHPVFMFGVFMALAYLQLLAAHRIGRPGVLHYATFPLFVAFPTWLFIVMFASNVAAAGLAMLLVCTAGRYYADLLDGRGEIVLRTMTRGLSAIAAGACAIGIYQSYLLAFAAIGIGIVLARMLREAAPIRRVAGDLAWLAVLLAGALAAYYAVQKLALAALHFAGTAYIGNFFHPHQLLETPGKVAYLVARDIGAIYAGHAAIYGISAFAFPMIVLCGLLGFATVGAGIARRLIALGLAAAMLIVPFGIHLLAGGSMPLRTLVAVPPVLWLCALAGLELARRWVQFATSIAVVLAAFQILQSSNLLIASNTLAREHDRALAAEIYRRVVAAHPGVPPQTLYKIDFYGAKPIETDYPRPPSSNWGYSFFEWDGGNAERILNYMKLQGYSDIAIADPARRQSDLAIFRDMPVWPDPGAVRIVDDVVLVKLGAYPGYPFNGL